MKKIILMVILTGAVYSQCDASNWQEYYNSAGTDMTGCNLRGANLEEVDLSGVNLTRGLPLWGNP